MTSVKRGILTLNWSASDDAYMKTMIFKIWRQADKDSEGYFETHELDVESGDSLFDTLDVINEGLAKGGKDPIAFDCDCREGICGTCGLTIDGVAHGPKNGTTTCQLHMHHFEGYKSLTIEPFRVRRMPIVKDLTTDKSALDRIIQAGGYISVKTGQQPEANSILISKKKADEAFSYAACIGCGACIAACTNGSAHLFAGAKIAQLNALPQGHPERRARARSMVAQLQKEDFGGCSNDGECEAVCPKRIKTGAIAAMQREFLASLFSKDASESSSS